MERRDRLLSEGVARPLCAGVQPGGGKIRDCLKTHLKDLSEGCQTVVLKAVNAKGLCG